MNSERYNDMTYGGTKDASNKHNIYNDELTPFDQNVFLSQQNIHFCSNVIKFSHFWVMGVLLLRKPGLL